MKSKFVYFLMSILKRHINSSSNFASFFFVMTHNSSVSFSLMHFLLWAKGSHQSTSFKSYVSGESLLSSSCHFPNHKPVFLQIFHHSSVLWKKFPLNIFRLSDIYFAQIVTINIEILTISNAQIKIHQIIVIFETKNQFFFRICNLQDSWVSLDTTLLYFFQQKFYILLTKGAYQSINLVKFHVSCGKSEILHFDELPLSKSCKVLARKS